MGMNNIINKLHERALRITYRDHESSFQTLLEKDGTFTVHEKNLQVLMIEMYKSKHGLSPSFMTEIFPSRQSHYALRNNNEFSIPLVRTVFRGTETLRFRGPQIWQSLPPFIKNSSSLLEFKKKIKTWNGIQCGCRLCQTFIRSLGFL